MKMTFLDHKMFGFLTTSLIDLFLDQVDARKAYEDVAESSRVRILGLEKMRSEFQVCVHVPGSWSQTKDKIEEEIIPIEMSFCFLKPASYPVGKRNFIAIDL